MDESPDDQQMRLETRLAFLERHVEEQDREVYRQGELLKRIVRESENLRERLRDVEEGDASGADERPPHY